MACRRRRQYDIIVESLLVVVFSVCGVRRIKCHCWTLPSSPLAGIEIGAQDTIRQCPHEHTDTCDFMFTVLASV